MTPLGQQQLNIPKAQAEHMLEPMAWLMRSATKL